MGRQIRAAEELAAFDLLAFNDGRNPWTNDYIVYSWPEGADYYRDIVGRLGFTGLGRIADLGAGFGRWSIFLAEANAAVVGYERNAAAVDLSRRLAARFGLDNLDYEARDFLVADLPAASFDGVWLADILHVLDRGGALARANRLLRPGGRLAIVDYNGAGAEMQRFARACRAGGLEGPAAQAALASLARGPGSDAAPNFGEAPRMAQILAGSGFNLDVEPIVANWESERLDHFDTPALASRLAEDRAFREGFLAGRDTMGLDQRLSFAARKTGEVAWPVDTI